MQFHKSVQLLHGMPGIECAGQSDTVTCCMKELCGVDSKHFSQRRGWTVHQEYEFAVEVTGGPPNSVFSHSKVGVCNHTSN
jgi:hypothetical protein